MGTTESLLYDDRPSNQSIPNFPAPLPIPKNATSGPTPKKPTRPITRMSGALVGGPKVGKRTLLQRLKGNDPYSLHAASDAVPVDVTIPYKPPTGMPTWNRIQLQVTRVSDTVLPKVDFVVILVRPTGEYAIEDVQNHIRNVLHSYLHHLDYAQNDKSDNLHPPVCVCIMMNFRDLQQDDTSTSQQNDLKKSLETFVNHTLKQYSIPSDRLLLEFLSTSLRNCYGLDQLHHFIYRTYLQKKREALEAQLRAVTTQIEQTTEQNLVSYSDFVNILESSDQHVLSTNIESCLSQSSQKEDTPQNKRSVIGHNDAPAKQSKLDQDTRTPSNQRVQKKHQQEQKHHHHPNEPIPSPKSRAQDHTLPPVHSKSNEMEHVPKTGRPTARRQLYPSTKQPVRMGKDALEAFLASDSSDEDQASKKGSKTKTYKKKRFSATTDSSDNDDDDDFFYDETGRFKNHKGMNDDSSSSSSSSSSPKTNRGIRKNHVQEVKPRQKLTTQLQKHIPQNVPMEDAIQSEPPTKHVSVSQSQKGYKSGHEASTVQQATLKSRKSPSTKYTDIDKVETLQPSSKVNNMTTTENSPTSSPPPNTRTVQSVETSSQQADDNKDDKTPQIRDRDCEKDIQEEYCAPTDKMLREISDTNGDNSHETNLDDNAAIDKVGDRNSLSPSTDARPQEQRLNHQSNDDSFDAQRHVNSSPATVKKPRYQQEQPKDHANDGEGNEFVIGEHQKEDEKLQTRYNSKMNGKDTDNKEKSFFLEEKDMPKDNICEDGAASTTGPSRQDDDELFVDENGQRHGPPTIESSKVVRAQRDDESDDENFFIGAESQPPSKAPTICKAMAPSCDSDSEDDEFFVGGDDTPTTATVTLPSSPLPTGSSRHPFSPDRTEVADDDRGTVHQTAVTHSMSSNVQDDSDGDYNVVVTNQDSSVQGTKSSKTNVFKSSRNLDSRSTMSARSSSADGDTTTTTSAPSSGIGAAALAAIQAAQKEAETMLLQSNKVDYDDTKKSKKAKKEKKSKKDGSEKKKKKKKDKCSKERSAEESSD